MNKIIISKGQKVVYKDKASIIVKIINISTVTIEEIKTNIPRTVDIKELKPYNENVITLDRYDIVTISEKDWEKANKRFEIIKPALEKRGDLSVLKRISNTKKVSIPTLYRWIRLYENSGLISSLAGKRKTGGIGKSRLSKAVDRVISDKIETVYLTQSKHSINKTIRAITSECKRLGLSSPHPNTIRNRIKNISDEERIKKRLGIKEHRDKYSPIKGNFPGADYPLSIVQIDHTLVDIILVDEHLREPYKRPWLTVAMDVHSRMVLGIYLSFESPGAIGSGMCLANAILPKEIWLEQKGVTSNWPAYGIMNAIHLDNAREFRGKMLQKACAEYGIDIQFRPVYAPHWGGHIERLLGTFAKEIHDLPGTTFSNKIDKGIYQSKEKAAMTLLEFEKWLINYITKIYHKRIHSTIKMSPEEKFEQGILGTSTVPGRGLPPRIYDERKVRIDFMPFVERTVQEYGVVIDHIHYYSDVLRYYIHDLNKKGKKKHVFKRDPRDISVIYFLDPITNEYVDIPYRNTSLPPISVWEYRDVIKNLKNRKIPINENSIFEAYEELDILQEKAIKRTKTKRRNPILDFNDFEVQTPKAKNENTDVIIKPFDDLDDEAFTYPN